MIPLEISKELNPNLKFDNLAEKYIFSNNETLLINKNIENAGNYCLHIKYNSIISPTLLLYINDKLIDNNVCKSKTGSSDFLISINYKNGPYFFNRGLNKLKIKSIGIFPEIYNIYLEQYTLITPCISQYEPSDFILIKNYNIYGGFYWNLTNVLVGLTICDLYRKIPIINFDCGFFINNSNMENQLIKFSNNWFSYYFKDPVEVPCSIYGFINSTNKKFPSIPKFLKNKNLNGIYFFNRLSFLTFNKINRHKEMCKKNLKLHPKIESYINNIKNQIFIQKENNVKYIGIHYRGTDKIEENNVNESQPVLYNYGKIYLILERKKKELEEKNFNVYFIITSDEIKFIDFMVDKFGSEKIIYYKDAIRSNINTSGVNKNFTDISPRNELVDLKKISVKEKTRYELRNKLLNNSVHIGHKGESNYKKGLDCLIDAIILDRCDILYKSHGNFSLFCEYFNKKKNLEVYFINDECNKLTSKQLKVLELNDNNVIDDKNNKIYKTF